MEPSEEIASTISNAGCAAASIAARISGILLAVPVEVSLCTTVTALIACAASADSFSKTRSGATPERQSPGTRSTSSPSCPAMAAHSTAKWPVSNASTLSPGESVLTREASHAPVPDDGKIATGRCVPARLRTPPSTSRARRAKSGPRWSIVGAAIARSTRSGTFVGPGIWRKCRPLWYAMTMSFARGTELAEALRRVVGGEVRFDSYTRHLFSRDASMYAIEPVGVVFPRDAADVAAVVTTAAQFGVPVLPRGAGTSLAGQTVGHAVVMDLSRHMNTIVEIDPERSVARVQPGVVQEQLNLAGAPHGLVFGPDTSTRNRATLGGMIGNNSAGSQSVRYGMTIDHVLTLDVVLSDASQATFGPLTPAELLGRAAAPTLDGTICRDLPRLAERHREAIATGFPPFWRQSGGYRLDRLARPDPAAGLDLAKFVVGSEGTLVTVVAATVQLVPAPRHRVVAVGHFTSVQAAIEATEDALACQPAAVELLDRTIIELSRQKIEYQALGSILN